MSEVIYKAQFDINVNKSGTDVKGTNDAKDSNEISKIKSISNISTNKVLSASPIAIIASLEAYAVKKVANTLISNIGLSTGNSFMQQDLQFGLNLAGGLLSSVVGGASAGSLIPGGAFVGAVIGASVWAFQTGLNWFSADYSAGIQKSIDRMNVAQIKLISGLGSSSFGRYSGSGELY